MYTFSKMTKEMAEQIAYEWKYDGEYSFYDMTADEEDLKEFLESEGAGYYIAEKDNEIIGYFYFEKTGEKSLDMALGMKPEMTGKGLGEEFMKEGMEFSLATFQPLNLTLSVAAFNKRAIKVYEKAGFISLDTFMQDTNGSTYEFIKMVFNPEGE